MFIPFDHFCLLIGLLNPFTLNIISDMLACTFAILLLYVSSLFCCYCFPIPPLMFPFTISEFFVA